jgi:photosystem II stability/assembly factor-like uncharacterized protein
MDARGAAVFVTALLLLTISEVQANGRFPRSQRVLEHPTDSERLFVASTFGLLTTPDRGQTWQYFCEQHFAKENSEGDPLLEVTGSGHVLSGISASLNRSSDCGCAWETVAAADENELVTDLTLDGQGAVLLLSYRLIDGAYVFRVSESTDDGSSFSLLSELPELSFATTLDVAPSDPNRVYVAGYDSSSQGQLAVSSDRGLSWTLRPIALASVDAQPYLAAVHPTDAEIVFVRTQSIASGGTQQDTLLWSRDAGTSWAPLIQMPASLFGFALAPDGNQLLVGYGDRLAPALFAEPEALGIYRAALADQPVFEKIYAGAVGCLRWTARGLYACLTEGHPEVPSAFTLGFSADPGFSLADPLPFTPLLDYAAVRGPPSCAADVCGEAWSVTCQALAAPCTAAPEPLACATSLADGGVAEPDSGPVDSDAATDGDAATPAPPAATAANDSGCTCSLPRPAAPPLGSAVCVALAALAVCRRRSSQKPGRQRTL